MDTWDTVYNKAQQKNPTLLPRSYASSPSGRSVYADPAKRRAPAEDSWSIFAQQNGHSHDAAGGERDGVFGQRCPDTPLNKFTSLKCHDLSQTVRKSNGARSLWAIMVSVSCLQKEQDVQVVED